MKKIKLLSVVLAAAAISGGLVSCGGNNDTPDPTPTPDPEPVVLKDVKIGLHANFGAGAGYAAIKEGYFKEEGINAVYTVGAGPALAASVVEGNLDISFMGGGVAWHYFRAEQPIKIVALDNLTDDDRLIATTTGKGKDLTIDSSHSDLATALKGATVGLDFTTTPYTFWQSLVAKLNESMTTGQKIWYEDENGNKLPEGLSDSDYVTANQVLVQNVANANITVAMQRKEYDFCVTFAPAATTLADNSANFKVVAKTSTHMPGNYTPSTWAVNTKWAEANPELFKATMRALVKGMNARHDNPVKYLDAVEEITAGQYAKNEADADVAVWLNASQQLELYENGNMMKYVENIRAGKQGVEGVDSKITAEMACDFSALIEACKALK